MPRDTDSSRDSHKQATLLSELPHDELVRYAGSLGLEVDVSLPSSELVGRIRQRQSLLIELDRDALLDIVAWARRPVRKSADKEELARQIAQIRRTNYQSLTRRGLVALARLRDIEARMSDDAEEVIDRLRKKDGFWRRMGLSRRRVAGSLIAWMVDKSKPTDDGEYHFLPESGSEGEAKDSSESLRARIEDHGVVGGLASRLRGAADEYIRDKLDEIEERIDTKLNDIDRRLAEWRDREVANRLRILKLTLIFTVIVAALSLGYNAMKSRVAPEPEPGAKQDAAQ